jgi:hypothetical protein
MAIHSNVIQIAYVSRQNAEKLYGVIFNSNLTVDVSRTSELRRKLAEKALLMRNKRRRRARSKAGQTQ